MGCVSIFSRSTLESELTTVGSHFHALPVASVKLMLYFQLAPGFVEGKHQA
jgi:hypothetical protein